MDGIYFEQGRDAAKQAASADDLAKLRPYPADSSKGRTWTNGFLWELHVIHHTYQKAVANLGQTRDSTLTDTPKRPQ